MFHVSFYIHTVFKLSRFQCFYRRHPSATYWPYINLLSGTLQVVMTVPKVSSTCSRLSDVSWIRPAVYS